MATPHQPHHHIPIKAAARKLPIKRKTFDAESSNPNPGAGPVMPAVPPSSVASDAIVVTEREDDLSPPPFKFQRIWQESDEIRFLQGLLDSYADGLSFPRDLDAFFDHFSTTMPQPYSRSQMLEKLRRLKKKFRVVSARLDRGLDAALLTAHDRALLHLSKQLWHPAFAASSPFSASSSGRGRRREKTPSSRVTVRVMADYSSTPHLSQSIPVTAVSSPLSSPKIPQPHACCAGEGVSQKTETFPDLHGMSGSCGIERGAAKAAIDMFDQFLKKLSGVIEQPGLLNDHALGGSEHEKGKDIARKWQEQRVAELDVLTRRLRLVLEHAISD